MLPMDGAELLLERTGSIFREKTKSDYCSTIGCKLVFVTLYTKTKPIEDFPVY